MAQIIERLDPDRLQIREGGGKLSLFGLPFFLAGIFLMLATLGVIPFSNNDELPVYAWPLLALMSLAFTGVGGALTFGRSWVVIDAAKRTVCKKWGLLVPMREQLLSIDGYGAVSLSFVRGDSDTADKFPVSLKARSGADLPICSSTTYAESWKCAADIAQHLHLEVEDATTDHPVTIPTGALDGSRRWSRGGEHARAIDRPLQAKSEVSHDGGETRIVIPNPRVNPVALIAPLIPVAITIYLAPSLVEFFRRTNTPGPVGWAFLGFMLLLFGVLPATTALNAYLRARFGRTIVAISPEGLRILERGAWRTRVTAAFKGEDIVDVDYSTRDSALTVATRTAEQSVLRAGHGTDTPIGPRTQWLLTAVARLVKSGGLTVKARSGLTTFGAGLDDEEIRYLHSVIRRALG